MKKTFMAGLMVATALTCAAPADAQNIFEALSETYNTNPTLQAQRAYLRSIDENVAIAKSGYRPNIALTGSYNDANRNSDIIANDGASKQTVLAATISQPTVMSVPNRIICITLNRAFSSVPQPHISTFCAIPRLLTSKRTMKSS